MDVKDLNRIKHMIEASRSACQYILGKERHDLDRERQLLSAIIRELEIIGEAATSISENTKSRYSDIPWAAMTGMRNRLIHAYFDIDHDIIWLTLTAELPKLTSQLERILSEVT